MKMFVIGLSVIPFTWLTLILISILSRAIRDTIKWRTCHIEGKYPMITLILNYPILFWDNLVRQTAAWGKNRDIEYTPISIKKKK